MWRAARQRLRLRQLELQLRSAELRLGLIHDAQALERPLQWAERGRSIWRLAGSLPRLWKTAATLSAVGGLAGLLRRFRGRRGSERDEGAAGSAPGRIARVWTWVSLGWRVWRWMTPQESATPTSASNASSASSAPAASTAPRRSGASTPR